MTNLEQRITRLEKDRRVSLQELAERVWRVLATPSLVLPAAYARIVELVNIARARKEQHERSTKPN
jgi:hypothetical protein